jgi:bifunctional non-homologous end joining protein LigD
VPQRRPDADRDDEEGRPLNVIRPIVPRLGRSLPRRAADAVWHSNRGDAAEARHQSKKPPVRARPPKTTRAVKIAAMPDFVAPELCTPVDRPPNGEGWCHDPAPGWKPAKTLRRSPVQGVHSCGITSV